MKFTTIVVVFSAVSGGLAATIPAPAPESSPNPAGQLQRKWTYGVMCRKNFVHQATGATPGQCIQRCKCRQPPNPSIKSDEWTGCINHFVIACRYIGQCYCGWK